MHLIIQRFPQKGGWMNLPQVYTNQPRFHNEALESDKVITTDEAPTGDRFLDKIVTVHQAIQQCQFPQGHIYWLRGMWPNIWGLRGTELFYVKSNR